MAGNEETDGTFLLIVAIPLVLFVIIVIILGVLSLFAHWWAVAIVSFLGGLIIGVQFSERFKKVISQIKGWIE